MSKKARDIFQEHISKGLIGPGSDIWGLPDAEEIISDYPLQRYFSGVLFPEREITKSQTETDDAVLQSQTEIEVEESSDENEQDKEESESIAQPKENENSNEEETVIEQNHFFPTNFGLTFCVDNAIKTVDVEFNFGLYYQPKHNEIKMAISEIGFNSFFDPDIPCQLSFKDILKYQDGFIFLSRELKGDKGGRGNVRSGEYKDFDEFRKKDNIENREVYNHITRLEKLVGSRVWKRKSISIKIRVPIESTPELIPITIDEKVFKELKVSYHIKKYEFKGKKYVKILLVNNSEPHPVKEFSNKKEALNKKCLFQSCIKVKTDKLLPYNSYQDINCFDEEAEFLNFLYKDVHSYGIGHNSSVMWNNELTEIRTSFLPEYEVNGIKNDFDENDFNNPYDYKILEKNLNIKNLSMFSELKKEEVLSGLTDFVNLYDAWIVSRKQKNNDNASKHKEIGNTIIKKLEDNCNRIKYGIDLLKDKKIFEAFKFTNTAMLIQFIISNDKNFNKNEKHLYEINQDIPYNDFSFFENYDFEQLGFIPKYRPFQLAFLLLSIEGIVNPNSKSRKEIVDLIWFPTGGGKTEAYLAVSAFTIIWRRLNNYDDKYKGTTIIMRYTLRLLTSQQFERASRLIVSLEFLRRNYEDDLREEPITIGLWIGQGSSPNKIEDAYKIVDEIDKEINSKSGNPEEEASKFQINACPWCGTKIITKNETDSRWIHGFNRRNNKFKMHCLNKKCSFHEEIPVQVVDEMLYQSPPTLLFATVDKFAMLAWKEDGHKFFNSLDDDKLPPDLIIQDELHLLSGPLGSIVGIFESVVEMLCTKNGIGSKIIASTATTRNTDHQISKLYGNRKVNIFPPSGISHKDSFFARECSSKRKYIGFIPTGKSTLDTQLQVLGHLLVARLDIYQKLNNETDNYWTIVSYYNSLKDVGKTSNKVSDEIKSNTSTLQHRLKSENHDLDFNYRRLENHTQELTSRVESHKIKEILKNLETKFHLNESDKGTKYLIDELIDLVLATNMISVGIDINRLNVMLINGVPRNIAEYIQATSRIGRKEDGLVVTLMDPNRSRDKSYFEHFVPFHQTFYKNIEPLSVTPFTENTIDKMTNSLLVTFVRHKIGKNLNDDVISFKQEDILELKNNIKQRYKDNLDEYNKFEQIIDELARDWLDKINKYGFNKYCGKEGNLLKRPSETMDKKDNKWVLVESMRDIDSNTYVQIKIDPR